MRRIGGKSIALHSGTYDPGFSTCFPGADAFQQHLEVMFKIKETDSAQVVTQIVDCMADVGFTGTVLEKKHCKYIPFYKDELVIIAPNMEKYRRIQEECPNDISWLEREHVIMREEGSGTRKEAEKRARLRRSYGGSGNYSKYRESGDHHEVRKGRGWGSLFCPGLPRQTRRKPGRCSYSRFRERMRDEILMWCTRVLSTVPVGEKGS